jgi:hypothetical protein
MYKIIVHTTIGHGGLSIGNVHLALRDHSIKCSFSKSKKKTYSSFSSERCCTAGVTRAHMSARHCWSRAARMRIPVMKQLRAKKHIPGVFCIVVEAIHTSK